MAGTAWALLPPVVAIALALITKEVYLSLLIGIVSGALLVTGFKPLASVETTFSIMGDKIGGNVDILIFLVLLGILVALITKSGASKAYGNWASKVIKSKRGALLSTVLLGSLIFVDDYFNCLTVGTVMRPVTDKYKISRAKLAYIIDATAAPVCIIAPISSWAAAVGSSLPEGSGIDGFSLFIRTIPFNLYAILTIIFMLYLIIRNIDYGAMKRYEEKTAREGEETAVSGEELRISGRGKVIDLVLPIAVLILFCISGMLYTGGILEGAGIVEAFANCDSARSLVLGSFFTLVVTFLLYLPRRVISFREFCGSFTEGFKAMTPAIMILCLAWTLSGICREEYLDIGSFVRGVVGGSALIGMLLPAIFFAVATGLSFATGTSWGTFGILIPIAFVVLDAGDINMLTIATASILAGAVCGDHISPISDTTILASAGAQCNHLSHVSTQIPYALTVAACCMAGYFAAGFTKNGWVGSLVGLEALAASLLLVGRNGKRTEK
ncbi:Na+/H+ antiporter NhaC family protein [Qiania dongpingensis]|uniref:Na+/H+ antiporter NhaC family protein n=1 Tax=Qiania dongpingensis TaxID=2763669 RepID=A0A7G9G8A4_9FIRM|nr:Na+/H+ antiporter NhaC family protein [Qiania dongpingensis]QNM07036.1 Na+/H+ antiporter NhaC family protein [Qiania dongpingensis]